MVAEREKGCAECKGLASRAGAVDELFEGGYDLVSSWLFRRNLIPCSLRGNDIETRRCVEHIYIHISSSKEMAGQNSVDYFSTRPSTAG